MSASPIMMPRPRLHVLPRVWATASFAEAAERVEERKRPHCVRLSRTAQEVAERPAKPQAALDPELAFYRKYTETLLQRYLKMSLDCARVPSFMGRELFRGNLMSHQLTGFDDAVIFVHDVGRCLEQLEPGRRHLVRRIAIEGYTQQETSAMLGIALRTVERRYAQAMDTLTKLLIERKMLTPAVPVESCQ